MCISSAFVKLSIFLISIHAAVSAQRRPSSFVHRPRQTKTSAFSFTSFNFDLQGNIVASSSSKLNLMARLILPTLALMPSLLGAILSCCSNVNTPFLSLAAISNGHEVEAFVNIHNNVVSKQTKRNLLFLASATSSSKSTMPDFSGGFDSDRIDALAERGIFEAKLMQGDVGVLGDNNNIKKKKTKKKKTKGPSTSIVARTLNKEGVIKLDGILSASTAAMLREEILERRNSAYDAISSGEEDWRKYFADVLLKRNRCDLLLPFEGNKSLQMALHEILISSNKLTSLIQTTVGDDATLYELSSLISEPGSPRQPVHPDNPYQEHSPLYTVFIALQDITEPMGPTIFLPRTNTASAHAKYNDVSGRDAFLESSPSVAALLNAGDASLFDSRTMHCGGANDEREGSTRVLLYMSFRNPRATEPIGNVGSILPSVKKMTIKELRSKLTAIFQDDEAGDATLTTSGANGEIQLSAEKGDALAQLQLGISYYVGDNGLEVNHSEAVRWFELAAAQGNAHAQFNLGCCHSLGVGVPQPNVERAIQLFQLAAEQDYPGAKEAYDEASEQQKNELQSP